MQQRPRLAAAILCAAMLAIPAYARAATVTSPSNGAVVNTVRPIFRWTVGAQESCDTVRLSRGSTRDALGRLTNTPSDYSANTATMWQPYYSWELLFAGRWYYQLACNDFSDGYESFVTTPRVLHVRSYVSALRSERRRSGSRASCTDCVDVQGVSFASSAPRVTLTCVVRRRGRIVGRYSETVDNTYSGETYNHGSIGVAVGRRVRNKKRVTVRLTATGSTGGSQSRTWRVLYRRG